MKKVLQIFQRDLKRLLRSPAAALVMVGVCILPSLYAWFNIAANMDPYGNTKNVKVAIANCDTGGHTDSMDLKCRRHHRPKSKKRIISLAGPLLMKRKPKAVSVPANTTLPL